MGIDRLTAINHYALTGAEFIVYCQEICPLCNFFRCCPALKWSLLHNLVPKIRVVDHAVIERREDSTGIKAVTGGTELSDS